MKLHIRSERLCLFKFIVSLIYNQQHVFGQWTALSPEKTDLRQMMIILNDSF